MPERRDRQGGRVQAKGSKPSRVQDLENADGRAKLRPANSESPGAEPLHLSQSMPLLPSPAMTDPDDGPEGAEALGSPGDHFCPGA